MNIAETSRFQRAAEAVAVAEHEKTRRIGIGGRRRHENVFQDDACRGGEEGLVLFSPGNERGPAEGLQHAEAFAQRFGKVGKKHDAEAAGENVVGFVRKGERLRVGFAEVDVGEAFLASELDRKSTRLNSSHGYISYAVFC